MLLFSQLAKYGHVSLNLVPIDLFRIIHLTQDKIAAEKKGTRNSTPTSKALHETLSPILKHQMPETRKGNLSCVWLGILQRRHLRI